MREFATPALPTATNSGRWNLVALVLAGIGAAASTWLIVGSDSDSSHVRWPLVVAPIAICLVPVLAPRRVTRIGAVAAQAAWCVLAAFSIGTLQLPALGALLAATSREDR